MNAARPSPLSPFCLASKRGRFHLQFVLFNAGQTAGGSLSDLSVAFNTARLAPGAYKGAQTAPHQDPDGDAMPSLLEYALDAGPAQPASRPAFAPGISASRLTLTFTPRRVAGLRCIVQASADLSDWSGQTDLTDQLTPGQPFTFTDTADLTASPRRFLRLKVTQSAPP